MYRLLQQNFNFSHFLQFILIVIAFNSHKKHDFLKAVISKFEKLLP